MAVENRIGAATLHNRRGLLLGLTLAEIMMIILFALLLLFGAVFEEELKEDLGHSEVEAKVFANESAVAIVDYVAEAAQAAGLGANELDDVLRELKLADDVRAAAAARGGEGATALTDSAASIQLQFSQAEERRALALKKLREKVEEKKAVARLAESLKAGEVTPARAAEIEKWMAAQALTLADLRQRLQASAIPKDQAEQVLRDAERKWADVAMDNRTLGEQSVYWRKRWEALTDSGAKGVTPCWATQGVVDFMYDIGLTDDGIIMKFNSPPQWADDYARLPAREIRLMALLPPDQFVAMTRPLFDYSKAKDCRFFVRIFDMTGPTAKRAYLQHRRAVEGHFYITDMKDARWPHGR